MAIADERLNVTDTQAEPVVTQTEPVVVPGLQRQAALRRWSAEFVGTAALLGAIVGSGIVAGGMGDGGQLFEHAVAVGAALFVLISLLAPVSGAHFNPAVTLMAAVSREIAWREVPAYIIAQVTGAVVGVALTHAAFGFAPLAVAGTERTGAILGLSEAMATAGLVLVIFGLLRSGAGSLIPVAVGTFIASAIYGTSSTAFANPAVTVARSLTDTWTGIRLVDVPWFVTAQMLGAGVGLAMAFWWFRTDNPTQG